MGKEKSFASFWQAFDFLYPNRNVDEQYQYIIAGADFIADLVAFLDTLQPVVDLMLRVQSYGSKSFGGQVLEQRWKRHQVNILLPFEGCIK